MAYLTILVDSSVLKIVFDKALVNRELGAIEWECGADLDPDVVYSVITGQPTPDYMRKAKAG